MAKNLRQIISSMGLPQERRNTSKETYPISIEALKMLFNYQFECELALRNMDYIPSESQSRCVDYMLRWLISDKAKAGLLIYGNVGVGKTTITKALRSALAVYRDMIKFWVEESKVGFDSEVREKLITKTYNCSVPVIATSAEIADAITDEDHFNIIKCSRFLVIDDLGVEPAEIKDYGTTKKPFEELIYSRYDRLLPTIITTNLDKDEIRIRYGTRVADRFNEMFNLCGIGGESFRGK